MPSPSSEPVPPGRPSGATPGYLLLSVVIFCAGIGAGVGALLGSVSLFLIVGVFVGFFAGNALVITRYRTL